MQPSYHPLVNIFGPEIRHVVPLFQRPYVWSLEDQWQPLWEDIGNLADRVLAANGNGAVAGHFLGTVVLEQALVKSGTISCREVIDGQQRLTTLQLFLKAAEHALNELALAAQADGDANLEKSAHLAARQLAALTANPAYGSDEEKYKVWPTNEDRESFRAVLDAPNSESALNRTDRMGAAYKFFYEKTKEWLSLHTGANAPRAFAQALKDHVRVIVLDLDNTDEPQAIFETLNAHGTPLLPADLIKNWLLWQAGRKNADAARLYNSYWRPFDADASYWRDKIGAGHAARERVDTFLQNWLARRTGRPVAVRHLYAQFLEHVSPTSSWPISDAEQVEQLMEDIDLDAKNFRKIDQTSGKTRFDEFLRRLKIMDVVVFHPLLLAVMRRAGSDPDDLDSIGKSLESYLVRRMVCGEQTRGYSTLGLNVLREVLALDEKLPAAPVIATYLATRTDTDWWPNDEAFKASWCTRRFYGGLRRNRVLMLLKSIEESYHRKVSQKSEPIVQFDFDALQIEHVMPQDWKAHWPLPPNDPQGLKRESKINLIGNLTLVSGALNPSLSHAAWLDTAINGKLRKGKRSGLLEHSQLRLNSKLASSNRKKWNEATIDKRSLELFEAAQSIWPSAPPLDIH